MDEQLFSLPKSIGVVGNIIRGSYSTDIDILQIHLRIRDILAYEGRKKEWEEYCSKVRPLLAIYDGLTTKRKRKIVIGDADVEPVSKIQQRLDVINEYLDISKRYTNIDITFHPPFEFGCQKCDKSVEDMKPDEERGRYICECGDLFGEIYSSESICVDTEKMDLSISKASYDDKTNFMRRLKSYQGFHMRKNVPELISFIDTYLQEKYQFPPAIKIRESPMDQDGKRRSDITSVTLLKEVLRETNNSIHFGDINPICYEMWGWKCPQIDHLVPKILDDYSRTQEIYKELSPNLSSINVELRLYWHLRIAGHECSIKDFKIPHSSESRKRNSETFKIMCTKTGLTFYPII